MKTIFILVLLLTITACGKGGGGGSSAPKIPTNDSEFTPPVDPYAPNPNHATIDYELVVTGCNGAVFSSVSFINYKSVDEDRADWNGFIGASGSTNISQVGREIFWQVDNNGGCPVTMKLYRENIYLETSVVVNPGESAEIFY